jgi:hypothetical protein
MRRSIVREIGNKIATIETLFRAEDPRGWSSTMTKELLVTKVSLSLCSQTMATTLWGSP